MRIEQLDLRTAPEADVRAVYDVVAANQREAVPHWEPDSWADFLGTARRPIAWRPMTWWVARHGDGTMVGAAVLVCEQRSTNRHQAEVQVDVHPSVRRRGLGRTLVRVAAERAAAEQRTMLDAACHDEPGPLAFATAVGFAPKLRERRSGVHMASVDRAMLERWATPVPGYEVLAWDGECPPVLLERLARAAAVMNTAPLEDYEMEPEAITPDELRELEVAKVAKGTEWSTVAAVDAGTGEIAGYTEMVFRPDRNVAEQGDTGVWPEHRNRGLGRLLKAVMLLRVAEQRPWITAVETWNAGSNAPMLRINDEIGFETVAWEWTVQGLTSDVLARTQP